MKDRAQQALYLRALDPVVETAADNNSYEFRQQRSCAGCDGTVFSMHCPKPNPQWILEGDIKSVFDRISHDWLLAHVPMDRAILQKWLNPGIWKNTSFTKHGWDPNKAELSHLRFPIARWMDWSGF